MATVPEHTGQVNSSRLWAEFIVTKQRGQNRYKIITKCWIPSIGTGLSAQSCMRTSAYIVYS